MPQPPRPATDRATGEIIDIYRRARYRLEQLVRDALERGATGTAAYYEQQLTHVQRLLASLQDHVVPHAAHTIAAAYSLGATAADRAIGQPAIGFSGLHQHAIDVLADNLTGRLNAAAVFVGRRVEDAFRKASLQQVAIGIAAGERRVDVSEQLRRKLIEDRITDATTGFVDARGRRWPLDVYTEMVARTTTREAVTAGTANRLLEAGRELVTITAHSGACQICQPFEGKTYALTTEAAERRGYPFLDQRPPFHANCRHVLTPAAADFEDFEQLLSEGRIRVPTIGDAPAVPPAPDGPGAPFPGASMPARDENTARRLLTQREIIEADPGPEAGAAAARNAALEAEMRRVDRARRKAGRDRDQELEDLLGPDLVTALEEFRQAGVKWAGDRDLKEALVAGDVDRDYIIEQAERELSQLEGRRTDRLRSEERRGTETKRFNCTVCGHFKNLPSDVCGWCGDDPVTWGGSAAEFDRAHGYDSLLSRDTGGSLSVRGRGSLGDR